MAGRFTVEDILPDTLEVPGKIFIGAWVIALAVLVGRLVELQIVRADYYRAQAKEVLLLPPKALPFVRGRILDRTGQVLVSEEPSWDV